MDYECPNLLHCSINTIKPLNWKYFIQISFLDHIFSTPLITVIYMLLFHQNSRNSYSSEPGICCQLLWKPCGEAGSISGETTDIWWRQQSQKIQYNHQKNTVRCFFHSFKVIEPKIKFVAMLNKDMRRVSKNKIQYFYRLFNS